MKDLIQAQEKDLSPSDKTWEERFEEKKQELKDWLYGTVYKGYDTEETAEVVQSDVDDFFTKEWMNDLLTSATIKAKTEYKEAILGEIDGMFDGYMGVETITINELEGIMKKHLEEPSK